MTRIPDLNEYSQHRHYRNLNPSPKNFLNALVAVLRKKKSRAVVVTLSELGIRCGNENHNNRTRLKSNREQLQALGFIKVSKSKSSKTLEYSLLDDWMNLTDQKYKEICGQFKTNRKRRPKKQHEEAMKHHCEYAQQKTGPWSAQDCVDFINSKGCLRRKIPSPY